jgi:Holliday junction resolvase RusA-like endonuclease
MTQELFIPGPLPGLNELISAAKGAGGSGAHYSRLKREWGETVWAYAKKARLKRALDPVTITFTWREKNRRRDLDNIAGGGQKLVLDGLVKAGVLEDDGWEHVYSIEHRFQVDPGRPGVLVHISPACPF